MLRLEVSALVDKLPELRARVIDLLNEYEMQKLAKGIIAAVAMLGNIQFENQVLVQLVYGASLSLPAVAVFLGILIGGTLLGVAGALLALPATATVKVLIQYWLDLRAGRIHVSPAGEAVAQAEPAA